MAILNIEQNTEVSSDCKNFYFHDGTPLWNAISHPKGYDAYGTSGGAAFNPVNINLSNTKLNITLPDGTIVQIDFVSDDYDLDRLKDTGTDLIQKTITYSDLGFATSLTDGIYKFQYILQDEEGVQYMSTCYIVQDCATCCCLDAKLAKITFCPTCKDQARNTRILYDLYMKRDSARLLAACGDVTGAQAALDFILDECGIKTCDSCN